MKHGARYPASYSLSLSLSLSLGRNSVQAEAERNMKEARGQATMWEKIHKEERSKERGAREMHGDERYTAS